MANKPGLHGFESRTGQDSSQSVLVVVEKVGRWNDGIKALPRKLRIKARDIVNLDDDQTAGLQHSVAFLQRRNWFRYVIEHVLQRDHIEVILAQGVVFKRTAYDSITIPPTGDFRIGFDNLIAVTIPA